MAVRKNEAITIGPYRILRIEFENMVPDGVNQRRKRHGRSRVSGVGLLHGIDRKRANGVDAELVEFCGAQCLDRSDCGTHACLHGILLKFVWVAATPGLARPVPWVRR